MFLGESYTKTDIQGRYIFEKVPSGPYEIMCDKIIWIGFIIFAFGSCLSISVAQIGIFSSLIAWIVKIIFFPKEVKFIKTELDTPLLIFACITIVVAFFSRVDCINSLNGVFKTVGLMSVYFLVVNNIKIEKIKLLITLIIISASIECIYGVYQSISGFRVLEDGRIAGSTGWPIFLGEILAIVISITFVFLLYRVFSKPLYLYISILLMFAVLVLTLARGSWLGMIFSVLLIGILKEKRIIYVTLTGLILIIALTLFLPHNKYTARLLSIVNSKDATTVERIEMWGKGLKIMMDYPFGIGVHNIDRVYPNYKSPNEKNWAILHSNFIQIAVERGIVGLAAFLWFIITFIVVSLSYLRGLSPYGDCPHICKATVLGVLSGFVSFIVAGFTEYNFGTSLVIQLVWFLLALSMRCMSPVRNKVSNGMSLKNAEA